MPSHYRVRSDKGSVVYEGPNAGRATAAWAASGCGEMTRFDPCAFQQAAVAGPRPEPKPKKPKKKTAKKKAKKKTAKKGARK